MCITNKGKEWEKRNSLWLLASLIAGSGAGLYWIGKKTGRKEWIELGEKHTIYAVVYVFLIWFFDASFFNTVALLLFARNMIKCIAQSLDIRAEALLRLEMLEDGIMKKIERAENERMKITNKDKQWEDDNMVWPSWSYLIFVNGAGLLKAGERSKVSKWGDHGLIYMALWWILSILAIKMGGIINTISAYTCLASYILCMIESNSIRTKYLLTLEMVQDGKEEVSDEDVIAALKRRIIDDYHEKLEEQKKSADDMDEAKETIDEEAVNDHKEETNDKNRFKYDDDKSNNESQADINLSNMNGINHQNPNKSIFNIFKYTSEDNSINNDYEDDDYTYNDTESNSDYNYNDNQSDYDYYNDNEDESYNDEYVDDEED